MNIKNLYLETIHQNHPILNQSFPDDHPGYLAIIEIPQHGNLWYETSDQSLEDLKEKIESTPYHTVWEVKELQKMTKWVEAILLSEVCHQEPMDFAYLFSIQEDFPEEAKRLIIQEINPYEE